MNNLKTYEELKWFSKEKEQKARPDDEIAKRLLEFIIKHCDEIDVEKENYATKTFKIMQAAQRNENDPLGEDDWDEESFVLVKYDAHYNRLTIDDQYLEVSESLRKEINDVLNNILTLRANKAKQAKIDKMTNLMKKFD